MGGKVRVFLNTKSGAGEASAERVTALFGEHGVEAVITRVKAGLNPASFAAKDGPEVAWIAAGGDGTVRAIAEAVRGTGRAMGVLALGTLNHFAKDLGLPLELEDAVAAIAAAETVQVDCAEVRCGTGGRATFVNNSSLGAYPAMVMERERLKKAGRDKWSSLLLASVKAFIRFRCMTVSFVVDGKERHCVTPFLFVGNNEYCLNGARLGKREHLDRGELSLYLTPGATRGTMLWMMLAAAVGRLKKQAEFEEFRPKEFTVDARHRKRLRVSLDGEVRRMEAPLTYRVRAGELRVLKRFSDL